MLLQPRIEASHDAVEGLSGSRMLMRLTVKEPVSSYLSNANKLSIITHWAIGFLLAGTPYLSEVCSFGFKLVLQH